MPQDCTVEDIKDAYQYAWDEGVKSLTVYRDGAKKLQPLTDANKTKEKQEDAPKELSKAVRLKLEDERDSKTHKFNIAGYKGYITVGLYGNGAPGELFIRMSKQGSTISGLLDAFSIIASISLQYGVPLTHIVSKMKSMRFQPSGFTQNKDIVIAKSIMDYLGRWLEIKFLDGKEQQPEESKIITEDYSGEPCIECGGNTIPSGACDVCEDCGLTSGCS
jgi:ribonucleoside-diphosphate reductase alpha chain